MGQGFNVTRKKPSLSKKELIIIVVLSINVKKDTGNLKAFPINKKYQEQNCTYIFVSFLLIEESRNFQKKRKFVKFAPFSSIRFTVDELCFSCYFEIFGEN